MKTLKPLLLSFSLLLGFPSITTAATYVVDKNGTGNFTTIKAAVTQAAADENTGPSRGYAYFTQASDMVWGSQGFLSLQVGMLISVDDRNWYEIAQIIDDNNLRVTRLYDGYNRFNSYKAVTVASIEIKPGIYTEKVNMQGLHFAQIVGAGSSRESVTIQSPENPSNPYNPPVFNNIENYGHIHFKNLTARNINIGAVMSTINADAGASTAPSDTNLHLENVHLDAQCCDVIYSPYGHVLIENSRLEGENDVLGGFFKSLTVSRSDIMSQRTLAIVNAGKAIFVQLLYNSLIEDSLILTKAHDPANPNNGNGNAVVVYGTNGNTLTIRNSVLVTDGGQDAIALNLTGGGSASTVFVEGSRLLARSRGTSTDIRMRAMDGATLKCTEYATVSGGGTPTVLPCP